VVSFAMSKVFWFAFNVHDGGFLYDDIDLSLLSPTKFDLNGFKLRELCYGGLGFVSLMFIFK
jgi:hypothetical protein